MRKTLTFKEISEALLNGKGVRVFLPDGRESLYSPCRINKDGFLVNNLGDNTPHGAIFEHEVTHEIVELLEEKRELTWREIEEALDNLVCADRGCWVRLSDSSVLDMKLTLGFGGEEWVNYPKKR